MGTFGQSEATARKETFRMPAAEKIKDSVDIIEKIKTSRSCCESVKSFATNPVN